MATRIDDRLTVLVAVKEVHVWLPSLRARSLHTLVLKGKCLRYRAEREQMAQRYRVPGIAHDAIDRRRRLRPAFPYPFPNAASLSSHLPKFPGSGTDQADRFKKIRLAAAVGTNEEIQRLEFNARIVRAKRQKISWRQMADQNAVARVGHGSSLLSFNFIQIAGVVEHFAGEFCRGVGRRFVRAAAPPPRARRACRSRRRRRGGCGIRGGGRFRVRGGPVRR
jgi:hypothetical protein